MKKHFLLILFLLLATVVEANPVKQMLERFQKGLSNRFKIEIRSSSDQGDYFELYGGGRKVTVRANNYVSAAFGINWYLKYYCHVIAMLMCLFVRTDYRIYLWICLR